MTSKLAVDALRNAVARRGDVAGCILHADRGSQFRSRAMARELRRHDMVGSMGRVGAAVDNAAMEMLLSVSSGHWQIGSASVRERVCQYVSVSVVAVTLKKDIITTTS